MDSETFDCSSYAVSEIPARVSNPITRDVRFLKSDGEQTDSNSILNSNDDSFETPVNNSCEVMQQ